MTNAAPLSQPGSREPITHDTMRPRSDHNEGPLLP